MAPGFFRYQSKNGVEYGTFCVSKRVPNQKNPVHESIYLGRVIDKEKGVFQSKERGIYCFNPEKGFFDVPAEFKNLNSVPEDAIDFGDYWIVRQLLDKSGYIDVIKQTLPDHQDTLLSLLNFKLLGRGAAYSNAFDDYISSYGRILYPEAKMMSHQLSDFCIQLGLEKTWRQFFRLHLNFFSKRNNEHDILIDNNHLSNRINCFLLNNNYKINNKMKIIYITDRTSNLPLYYKFISKNENDLLALKSTINELSTDNINIDNIVLDVNYYSTSNIIRLHDLSVPYLIKVPKNMSIYKELVRQNLPDMNDVANQANDLQQDFLVKVIRKIHLNNYVYFYIITNVNNKSKENKLDSNKKNLKLSKNNVLILVSNNKIKLDELFQLYFAKKIIKKNFNIEKNKFNCFNNFKNNEFVLNGHLMISFISNIVYVLFRNMLSNVNISPTDLFSLFKTVKGSIMNGKIYIKDLDKKEKDILKHFSILLDNIISIK
ncbi:MAG: transposase [Deltaproteobacteria bacterium]|jgi:hypothetical protein|nr:transposase [Deltaproteobacteria bacterium]